MTYLAFKEYEGVEEERQIDDTRSAEIAKRLGELTEKSFKAFDKAAQESLEQSYKITVG